MIDWERVGELYEQVGKEALPEVLSLFEQEVAEGLERLKAARAPNVIAAEFHFLKGAALNLGMNDMARCYGEGETRALRGEDVTGERDRALDEFPRVCAVLMAEWRTRLGA